MKHASDIKLSIIIPSCNRAEFLKATLESLPDACAGQTGIELLVIDNGSRDHTRDVVEAFALKAPFPVVYRFAPCPGLHVGRNLGAQLAAGSILAYLDDDVIVQPGWAKAILTRFAARSDIALVGGPCRPLWEIEPPAWLSAFRVPLEKGWYMGVLSLIDMGDEPREVSGTMIFGCNFAVRKEILMQLKGFRPDGVPDHLLQYRGDGETGVGESIDATPGITAFYDPDSVVLHRIPAKRMTSEYLLHIAKRSGYGSAFSRYRKERPNGWVARLRLIISEWGHLICVSKWRAVGFGHSQQAITHAQWKNKLLLEKARHLTHICLSRTVSRWVCQESYFVEDPCPYWPQATPRNDV